MLCSGATCLTGFAPPRLEYRPAGAEAEAALAGVDSQPVVSSPNADGAHPATDAPRIAAAHPASRPKRLRLAIDMSAIADTNTTNGSDLEMVALDFGDGPIPVPLDPNLREKPDVGLGVSVSAGARIPLAEGVVLAADAEAYSIDYGGRRSDDSSVLVAAGLEFGAQAIPDGSAQLFIFERGYAGLTALRGIGARASYRHAVGEGRSVRLALDARVYDSGYGDAFDGREGSVYLSYDSVLSSELTMATGVYVRREWLRDDAFSSLDAGVYGGLGYYIGDDIVGGFSVGLSRTLFDEPFLLLGAERRRDWRGYGSLYFAARRPIGWGLVPSLTYSYNRTSSSIAYYSSDRHRLRLGVQRKF